MHGFRVSLSCRSLWHSLQYSRLVLVFNPSLTLSFPFWRSTIDYHSFAKSTICTCTDVQSFLQKKYYILFCTCYPLSITLLKKLLSPFPFLTLNNSYIQKDVPWQKHEDPTWHLSRHVWTSSNEAVICTTRGYWTNSNLGNFPISLDSRLFMTLLPLLLWNILKCSLRKVCLQVLFKNR